ncbi:MAG: hypothetical protein AB7O98_07350 [Hyphomonadaceae bacterium]
MLEALIAVAIVAMALVPIMSLESQLTRRHAAQRAEHASLLAQQNALAIIRDMNVWQSPDGSAELQSGSIMRWRATPLSSPRRSLRAGNGEGDFEIVLYRLDVEILDRAGNRLTRFSVDKLGWRRAADGQ